MPFKLDYGEVTFSSGRTAMINNGIVSINPDFEIHYGYDSSFPWPPPNIWRDDDDQLTADDMRELADHMIDLWTEFKGKLTKDPAT